MLLCVISDKKNVKIPQRREIQGFLPKSDSIQLRPVLISICSPEAPPPMTKLDQGLPAPIPPCFASKPSADSEMLKQVENNFFKKSQIHMKTNNFSDSLCKSQPYLHITNRLKLFWIKLLYCD